MRYNQQSGESDKWKLDLVSTFFGVETVHEDGVQTDHGDGAGHDGHVAVWDSLQKVEEDKESQMKSVRPKLRNARRGKVTTLASESEGIDEDLEREESEPTRKICPLFTSKDHLQSTLPPNYSIDQTSLTSGWSKRSGSLNFASCGPVQQLLQQQMRQLVDNQQLPLFERERQISLMERELKLTERMIELGMREQGVQEFQVKDKEVQIIKLTSELSLNDERQQQLDAADAFHVGRESGIARSEVSDAEWSREKIGSVKMDRQREERIVDWMGEKEDRNHQQRKWESRKAEKVVNNVVKCYKCMDEGHWKRDCPNLVKCKYCKEVGHWERSCQKKGEDWARRGRLYRL